MNSEREQRLLAWAGTCGPETQKAFLFHLNEKTIFGIRFCLDVRILGEQYGTVQVEAACSTFQRNGGQASLSRIRRYLTSPVPSLTSEDLDEGHLTPGVTRGQEKFTTTL
ncbi:MAG: hypothetical protein IJS84_10245 [Spirochaetales bacterium]|nr:hypothetical protein [Spirochaetales bacterium]